jgi:hypothetical protein
MKYILSTILLFFFVIANAQSKLIGKVIDNETKKPLEDISIFLSHTTIGSITNAKGDFQLDHLKPGKYELVATSFNYEDIILSIQVGQTNEPINIAMNPTANLLKEVVVESYDENGWERWGDSFKSYFVGSPILSKNCQFKNPEVLKFKFGANSNKLRAFTNEKLIFENAELGYRIIYLLSKFEIDFNNNTFSFKGYPFFEELKSDKAKQIAAWNKARNEVYTGSLRHFIRSLYNNSLAKDGFELRTILNVSEDEIARIKELNKTAFNKVSKDSLDYYTKVKNIGFEETKVVLSPLVACESLVSAATESNSKIFYFTDHLQVLNLNKKIPNEFAKTLPVYRANENIRTDLSLRTNSPIFIYANGDFYNGLELLTDGYWAWSEKVCTMLPSDYQSLSY